MQFLAVLNPTPPLHFARKRADGYDGEVRQCRAHHRSAALGGCLRMRFGQGRVCEFRLVKKHHGKHPFISLPTLPALPPSSAVCCVVQKFSLARAVTPDTRFGSFVLDGNQ